MTKAKPGLGPPLYIEGKAKKSWAKMNKGREIVFVMRGS